MQRELTDAEKLEDLQQKIKYLESEFAADHSNRTRTQLVEKIQRWRKVITG